VVIIELQCARLGISSRNSSTPPSQDPHRTRGRRRAPGEKAEEKRKPGGQPGHLGETLERILDPDHVEEILVDRRTIPKGISYRREDDEVRQVIDIEIRRQVTDYRAEVLRGSDGTKYRAASPPGVTRPVQYGASVKAEATYMSKFQLLPYGPIQDYFKDQKDISISTGTLCSINQEAYELLGETRLRGYRESTTRRLERRAFRRDRGERQRKAPLASLGEYRALDPLRNRRKERTKGNRQPRCFT
jgi:transposase